MKKLSFNKKAIGLLGCLLLIIASCNRKFDVPPSNADPEIDVTMTIMELKARYTAIGDFKRIDEDEIISGVVIADDASGNFYKQVVIQDETGGLPVLLEGNNLYTQFPVGRRIFLKLKGLMLGDYGGTIQLGIDSSRSDDGRFLNLTGIPQAMFDQYIIKGSFHNTIIPKVVKPSDFTKSLNDPLLSTLVQIENAEFKDADINKTYADPSKNTSAINFTINTCDRQSIVLRNSSYARFAGINVPDGNGVLIGVPSVFNGTLQIFIRDTADVQFSGIRCSGQAPIPTLMTIEEVQAFAGGDSSIPAGVYIKGVVVSDTKNEAAGNYRLQDATGAIQIRFANASVNPNASLGDSLTVTVGGLSLSTFNGGLQISGVTVSEKSGTGIITPKSTTISEIIANNRTWESSVVTINNVFITILETNSTGTNYLITDATGSLKSFVRNTAEIVMPASAERITGYVSIYQSTPDAALETQLTLRRQEDIEGGFGGAFAAVYTFNDVTNTSGAADPTPSPAVDGLMFGSFTAVGVSANSSASGRFSFTGWPLGATNGSDNFTGNLDTTRYYEVTITPAVGRQMDLYKIAFTLQRSGTGVRQVAVRSSINGFADNLPVAIDPPNSNLTVVDEKVVQISDAATTAQNGCVVVLDATYTNITTAVTFRFYGFNAESSGGTFSIDNVRMEGVVK